MFDSEDRELLARMIAGTSIMMVLYFAVRGLISYFVPGCM